MYGQFVAFSKVSHTVTAVEFIVVLFIYAQDVTQEELDLYTKLGEAQAEHKYAAGEPREEVWIPNGRAQVALHSFSELFTK